MAISAKNQALSLLNDEHRSLAAVIHALQFLLRRMQEGKPANADLLGAILHYLTRFPERLHHPAEDRYLFAPLRARTTEAREVLDLLEQEHAQGPQREARLLEALSALNARMPGALESFAQAVDAYANFYWAHMAREESIILPLAERLLSDADWQAAAAGFSANADPRYGGDTAQDFKALFSRIVNQTPAPEGLGREEV
jgi:hemerythrin-like domain-containing protein